MLNACLEEQPLDAFLGRLRLRIDAETGSVWSQSHIDNRFDAALPE
jgi:hypothetical protein